MQTPHSPVWYDERLCWNRGRKSFQNTFLYGQHVGIRLHKADEIASLLDKGKQAYPRFSWNSCDIKNIELLLRTKALDAVFHFSRRLQTLRWKNASDARRLIWSQHRLVTPHSCGLTPASKTWLANTLIGSSTWSLTMNLWSLFIFPIPNSIHSRLFYYPLFLNQACPYHLLYQDSQQNTNQCE